MTENLEPLTGDDACARAGELIAWYPGPDLDAGERRAVEAHVATCPRCADLLRLACDLQGILAEIRHPSAEELVAHADRDPAEEPRRRREVAAHLADCAACREQVAILAEVTADLAGDEADGGAAAALARPRAGTRRPRPGDWFRRVLLGPVPAAAYLAASLLAIGLLVLRVGPERGAGTGAPAGATGPDAGFRAAVTAITLLPDETDRLRRPGEAVGGPVRLAASRPAHLQLELMNLPAEPAATDLYTVTVLPRDGGPPALTATVAGETFRDNYTLALHLQPGALAPGRYTINVRDPAGTEVFRSSILVE